MNNIFDKLQGSRKADRQYSIEQMNYDELVALKYKNDLNIPRLRKKAEETMSTIFSMYLTSKANELEWENEIIISQLNA